MSVLELEFVLMELKPGLYRNTVEARKGLGIQLRLGRG